MKTFRLIFFTGIFLFFSVSSLHSFIVDRGTISSQDTLGYNNHSAAVKDGSQKSRETVKDKTGANNTTTNSDSDFQDAVYKLQRDAMLKEKKRLLRQSAERRNKLQQTNTYKNPDLKYSYFNTSQKLDKPVYTHKAVIPEDEQNPSKELSKVNWIANFLGFIAYITFIGAIIVFFVRGGRGR